MKLKSCYEGDLDGFDVFWGKKCYKVELGSTKLKYSLYICGVKRWLRDKNGAGVDIILLSKMSNQNYRKEFKEILERTLLLEGISSEEMKEKLLPLSKLIIENIPLRLFQRSNT